LDLSEAIEASAREERLNGVEHSDVRLRRQEVVADPVKELPNSLGQFRHSSEFTAPAP
jgi:hypothetical protein